MADMTLTAPQVKGMPISAPPVSGIPIVPQTPPEVIQPTVAPQVKNTPTDNVITVDEIGRRFKAKHADNQFYAAKSDAEIGQAVIKKNPSYNNLLGKPIGDVGTTTQHTPQAPTTQETPKNTGFFGKVANFFTGATQKFADTLGTAAATVAPASTDLNQSIIPGKQGPSASDVINQSAISEADSRSKLATLLNKLGISEVQKQHIRNQLSQGTQNVTADVALPSINKTARQIYGEGLGTGLEALSGGGLESIGKGIVKTGLKEAVISGAKTGAVYGGLGSISGATQDNKSVVDIAKSGLTGAAFGGVLGGSLGGLSSAITGKKLSGSLKDSAEKGYAQVLAPTTKENKAITQRIVPRLIGEGKTALSRTGLLKKAEKGLDAAGVAMDDALGKIPKDALVSTKNIIAELEKTKEAFLVTGAGGKVIEADPQAIKHIEGFQKILSDVGAEQAPFESVRRLRQIWDSGVQSAKGFYGKTLTEGSLLEAQKAAADSIRKELVKGRPDLAKANADYHFWSNVQKVLSETIQRKQGQARPLTETIRRVGGAAAGAVVGGAPGAIAGDIVMGGLTKLVDSTAWKTIGAIRKAQIAEYLAKGNTEKAMQLITRLISQSSKSN